MALVEIEAGPFLITSAVTRDAVEELGLAPGVRGDGGGEGDVGHGAPAMRWLVRWRSPLRRSWAAASDDEPAASEPRLVVSAAASLSDALTACSEDFEGADVKLSFAGSDELAAQIRQGVKPDVYAAANTRLPEELAQEGLLGTPVEFATNELVIAVGGEGTEVERGRRPRQARHPARDRRRVRAGRRLHARGARPAARRARGEDPRQRALRGARRQGRGRQAHAGRRRRRLRLPDRRHRGHHGRRAAAGAAARPWPTGRAWSRASRQPELAQQYLDGLTEGPCADALREEGFGPPPAG